jgi:hypothetical protein
LVLYSKDLVRANQDARMGKYLFYCRPSKNYMVLMTLKRIHLRLLLLRIIMLVDAAMINLLSHQKFACRLVLQNFITDDHRPAFEHTYLCSSDDACCSLLPFCIHSDLKRRGKVVSVSFDCTFGLRLDLRRIRRRPGLLHPSDVHHRLRRCLDNLQFLVCPSHHRLVAATAYFLYRKITSLIV